MRASGRRISIFDFANERFWQLAVVTAAGTVGLSTQASAALYYWNGPNTAYYSDDEPVPQRPRPKPRRNVAKKDAAAVKETGTKPQGPVVISISIDQQRVRVYDTNGLYAESPVSTGMKGHLTPMGVFSIIQKQKYHQSNIYSGAPMPYMQRITWSGIAMHAGVLPGYPASHGCIRMPMGFAVKMYNWTRMGARVIVTPGSITPESFSHPLLVTQKVAPQQPVADEVLKMDAPLGVKGDKGADKPESSLELRSSVGHAELAGSLRDNTHTADASGAMPATSTATASDVSSSASNGIADASEAKGYVGAAKADAVTPAAAAGAAKAGPQSANAITSAAADDKTIGETPVTASIDVAKGEFETNVSAGDRTKAQTTAEAPKADTTKTADRPTDKSADKAAEPANAAEAPASDAKKDAARLPGVVKADLTKRGGPIAVFISRKDSKLYVRQNFAPLFDAPVTIAPGDRPLGTHVFTAEADKTDPNTLRWTVVTLPTRSAVRFDDADRTSRRHKMAGAAAVEVKSQPSIDTPAEALDRITIPADVMARISEALGTGGSIIVSDLGINQGETGEGTDFIVPLR